MSKKIGILSMQQIYNYGSFLQAFALKKILECNDGEVSFINVEKGRFLEGLNPFSKGFKYRIKRLIKILCKFNYRQELYCRIYDRKWRNEFDAKYFKILGVENETQKQHYNLVVIGSDEVFNCVQLWNFGFTTQLFGDNLDADQIVSYAASFGHTTIHEIDKYKLRELIASALSKLSAISVRDEHSFDSIRYLINRAPYIHFDPVIVFDFSRYIPDSVTMKDFIIVYSYPNRITKEEARAIIKFAKKTGKKLVSIQCLYTWCNKAVIPDSPFEVLDYFRKADYIVTDTFHGCIFSMKFGKQFCVLIRNSNRQKLGYLLKCLHLESQELKNINAIDTILSSTIDYRKTKSEIERQTNLSYIYLKQFL
jgi:polysaccharide pyruvyl transferase WcaK-like protein